MSPSFVNSFLDQIGSSVSTTSINHSGFNFKLHFFFVTTFILVSLLALRFDISSLQQIRI